MSGDFSRFTFEPNKHYSKVLMQQGRVILDADWNEMQSIISQHNQLLTNDLVGEAAYPADNPAFTPKISAGLTFDGNDNFLLIENHSLDFSSYSHFTILTELSVSDTGADAVIFSQWDHITELGIEAGLKFGISAEGAPYLQRTIAINNRIEIEKLISEVTIPYEQSVQLAVTFDDVAIRLFIDAKEVLCASKPNLGLLGKGPISIGAQLEERMPHHYFKGKLFDMCVFSRALSLHELQHNPFTYKKVGEIGLQAWWPFTEGKGEFSRDISGHENNAILGPDFPEYAPAWLPKKLVFGSGRVYLDGIVAEQFNTLTLPLTNIEQGHFLAYVDMHQTLVSAIDDPSLLEPGLMGADTSVRMQTQLAVKLFPQKGVYENIKELNEQWQQLQETRQRVGQIKVTELSKRAPLKSTLYRIQIVENADLKHHQKLSVVWSADNSSMAYRVTHHENGQIRVIGLERSNRKLTSGSYFSLLDSAGNHLHDSAELLKATNVDIAEGIVSYSGKLMSDAQPVKLLQWHQAIDQVKSQDNSFELNIDSRLSLSFKPDAFYLKGDYWLIPTRAQQDSLEVKTNTWISPFEVRSQYQPIAYFQAQDSSMWLQKDCRKVFFSAVQMDQFLRSTGGTMTGPLVIDDTLTVEDSAEFNSDVIINGELNSNVIGTSQLKDHSVTHHKLAHNLGLQLGQCVLSQIETPPPGYAKVGKIIGDTEHSTWQMNDSVLPAQGPFCAHNIEQTTLLFYGEGELFELEKEVGSASITPHRKAPFPGEAIRQFASCVVGDKLYIAGGKKADGNKTSEFYCYYLSEDRWEKKAELAKATSHMALCAWQGKVFAMGGMETTFFGLLTHNPSRKLACYDHSSNSWQPFADMPDYRYSGGVAEINGLIHYIGGSDRELSGILSETFCQSHFVYNPENNCWHEAYPIPLARSRFGILALNDKIYCLGGRTGISYTANVQVYNPETDYWEAEASLHIPRSHIAPILLDEVIFALGGKLGSVYTDIIENQKASSDFFVHRLESYLE
jgi:hypothetical protein